MDATCLACGCTDSNACEEGCSWQYVCRIRQVGICNNPQCLKWFKAERAAVSALYGRKPEGFSDFIGMLVKPKPDLNEISEVGDLKKFAQEVEDLFTKRFGERPALAIAFVLSETRPYDCHWVTNCSRIDGIRLFAETVRKMLGQAN